MTPFLYERATNQRTALSLGARSGASFLGGGTNLVDLMQETIANPTLLVDVAGLSREIEDDGHGGLKVGAGFKNTAAAADRRGDPLGSASQHDRGRNGIGGRVNHGNSVGSCYVSVFSVRGGGHSNRCISNANLTDDHIARRVDHRDAAGESVRHIDMLAVRGDGDSFGKTLHIDRGHHHWRALNGVDHRDSV